MKHIKLDNEIKEKLIDYFYEGLTPTLALEKLKSKTSNYLNDSKFRSRIPYLRTVYYLFEKERNINFGSTDVCLEKLSSFESEFNSTIKLKYLKNDSNQWVIAFCSKIMIGALKIREISEKIICIDSSGGMDRTCGHLFNLVIPNPIGGLSIGMFITFSESKTDISIGLNLLKEIWSENKVQTFNPKCIMSDDSASQIGAVSEVFPNSTIFLCIFHVKQALWRWLQSNETKENRQSIIYAFNNVIFARNFPEQKKIFFEKISNNEKLTNYFNKVFKKEKMFAIEFRQNIELFGANTNNLVERSFLAIKQQFLERNKVYNVIQLMQQISLRYESFISIKLIDLINGRKVYIYKAFRRTDLNALKDISKAILDNKFDSPNIVSLYGDKNINIEFNQDPVHISSDESLNELNKSTIVTENELKYPEKETMQELNTENLLKAHQMLDALGSKLENIQQINTWTSRFVKCKTDSQRINFLMTGGVTNKNILKVQSRITKNSHKNRFPSLAQKSKSSKPRNLAQAIKNNVRNKITQSKK